MQWLFIHKLSSSSCALDPISSHLLGDSASPCSFLSSPILSPTLSLSLFFSPHHHWFINSMIICINVNMPYYHLSKRNRILLILPSLLTHFPISLLFTTKLIKRIYLSHLPIFHPLLSLLITTQTRKLLWMSPKTYLLLNSVVTGGSCPYIAWLLCCICHD